jgi:glyoxylase-like metal-dependent hydrolase (beta-lactamase superfamily II)
MRGGKLIESEGTAMSDVETYEVLAIRYATKPDRRRYENFLLADPHDGPMPIDYFVWVIRNAARTIVVDTGFGQEQAKRRARTLLRPPREGLARVGVDAARVENVVITHLHYDHAGTLGDFPNARFHVQEREMSFATGRHMAAPQPFAHAYAADDVCNLVRCVFDGRVEFHDGTSALAPGVSLHRLGGHTMGLQCVRVHTRRGWVVLASDASHFYENMEKRAPFPIVYSVADVIDGFRTMRALAESDRHVIPGHDPLVLSRYPAPDPALEGVAVRLDAEPNG